MTPKATAYYFSLRKQGYRPRTACFSVLMRYSGTQTEYSIRANRVARLLNQIDMRQDAQTAGNGAK